jgi:hypothetical protein
MLLATAVTAVKYVSIVYMLQFIARQWQTAEHLCRAKAMEGYSPAAAAAT